MDILDAILTPDVLHGIVIVGALVFIVRSLLIFSKESAGLRPKLDEADRSLTRLREGMENQKKKVASLSKKVEPLQGRFDQMNSLHEKIKEIEDEDERKVAQAETEEEEARNRRVKRKKMGYGGEASDSGNN